MQEINLMSDKQNGLVLQRPSHTFLHKQERETIVKSVSITNTNHNITRKFCVNYLENLGSSVCIDGTEDIVEKIDIAILVDSSSELNPLFLTTAKVDSALSDLGLVPELHHFQVFLQATDLDNFLVLVFIHRLTEKDVFLNRPVLNPRGLGNVGS